MEIVLSKILSQIRYQKDKISSLSTPTSEEAYQMTLFLKEMLYCIKDKILENPFKDEQQEIDFFKNVKPQVLGKLIYYNKIFRIETDCPVSKGMMYFSYFESQLNILKSEYKYNIWNTDFYRYHRAGRTDRDHWLFQARINQLSRRVKEWCI